LPCFDGCATCDHGGKDDYSDCLTCESTAYELVDIGGYKFCAEYCPWWTTYNNGGNTGCSGSSTNAWVSLSFNVPWIKFSNSGDGGSDLDATPTQAKPSGIPVKNRGIYFDGASNGYIKFVSLYLNTQLTIRAWVLTQQLGGYQTVFSKDNIKLSGSDYSVFWFGLDTDGKVLGEIINPNDENDSVTSSSNTAMQIDNWYHVALTTQLSTITKTEIQVYINGAAENAKQTKEGVFFLDNVDYESTIGIERDGASSFTSKWNGYLYEFDLNNTFNASFATGRYIDTGCNTAFGCFSTVCPSASECLWTVEWNEFVDEDKIAGNSTSNCNPPSNCVTTCDPTSCGNDSCVRDEECHFSGCSESNNICHLCDDRECTHCLTYDSCEASKCGTNASSPGGTSYHCQCNEGFALRDSDDVECKPCHVDCDRCDKGDIANYSDCTQCDSATEEVDIDGTYKYCLGYCPTGYTDENWKVCTKPAGDVIVFCSEFDDFANEWTNTNVKLINHGAYPAKHRGQYFDGQGDYMVFDNNFTLGFNFSLFTWVRLDDDFAEDSTLF
jgi:hypothetical protein